MRLQRLPAQRYRACELAASQRLQKRWEHRWLLALENLLNDVGRKKCQPQG